MRLKLLFIGMPALATLAFAQTETQPSTGTQSETRTSSEQRTETHTKTEKGKSFKGMLVDANCGGGMSSTGSANRGTDATSVSREESSSRQTSEQTQTSESTAGNQTERRTTEHTTAADRSATEGTSGGMAANARWQSCPATESTTAFGLVTSDGKFMKFDDAGNTQAAQELKNNTKWTQAATSGKPAKVKVKGTLMGDTLQVREIK